MNIPIFALQKEERLCKISISGFMPAGASVCGQATQTIAAAFAERVYFVRQPLPHRFAAVPSGAGQGFVGAGSSFLQGRRAHALWAEKEWL